MAASVLAVNAGSSSLKLRLLGGRDELLASAEHGSGEPWGEAIEGFLAAASAPDAVGHRVVHGGTEFTGPTRVDSAVEGRLERLADLAPLHNRAALQAIRIFHRLRPNVPAIACFDTSFHSSLPREASTYALPRSWTGRWPLRRFGFHGLSHAYASRRIATLLGLPLSELRTVVAHLGAGASLAAVDGGRSVDTTMGFTPLEGLVMATRSGSVDPGLLLWVQRHGGIGPQSAERALDREAGLLGLSGRSADMRELLDAAAGGDHASALAVDVYLHRLRASIASMAAAMGGLDALAFTGGVGEGSHEIRERACRGLGFLGLEVETERNGAAVVDDRQVDAPTSSVAIFVIHAREDLEIAAQVRSVLEDDANDHV